MQQIKGGDILVIEYLVGKEGGSNSKMVHLIIFKVPFF